MYGKMKQNNTGSKSSCDTVVGAGSHMKGEIQCKGASKIAGHFDGDLTGDDKLFVGPDATIVGSITALEIEVDGNVKGTLTSTGRIILNETAVVEGDINSPSIIIEEGARFNGTSHMEAEVSKKSNILSMDKTVTDEKIVSGS